jgi:hypothetical protein
MKPDLRVSPRNLIALAVLSAEGARTDHVRR